MNTKFKLATYRGFKEHIADMEEPENYARIASALWLALLALVVVFALLSVAYGVSLIQDVLALSDASNTAAQKSSASNSNRKDLDVIVGGFSARKDLYNQLKAQPVSVSDPSQ